MFLLRDLPKYDTLMSCSARYPSVEPAACEAYLVLLRVASDVLGAVEAYLASHGLSQGRFTVMMILNRHPDRGTTPSDLAARCGVTRATMTGLLDGLEREGLVTRSQHHEDRRMVTVRLTEAGSARLEAMLPDYFSRVASLMSGLGHEERRGLVELLRQVRPENFMVEVPAGAAATDQKEVACAQDQ